MRGADSEVQGAPCNTFRCWHFIIYYIKQFKKNPQNKVEFRIAPTDLVYGLIKPF